jgi:hypothetical protein
MTHGTKGKKKSLEANVYPALKRPAMLIAPLCGFGLAAEP